LRCKRLPHPADSPDLAICDFDVFGRLEQQFRGITVETAGELINEVTKVLTTLSIGELRRAFDHSIKRCDWVRNNGGEHDPEYLLNDRFVEHPVCLTSQLRGNHITGSERENDLRNLKKDWQRFMRTSHSI
jgi:hypothetical protein